MDQAEELHQIATWLSEEGLAPDSSKEAQLCLVWRSLQHTKSCLCSVTKDLEMHRSQHVTEMEEVRNSLKQIRIFTEHKDVLAQEIQDENDQLREQLQRLISLQDAQISEVAKMLYQQGLTELIHSSPSEQVAYLLVERASLLETPEDPDKLMCDRNPERHLEMEAQAMTSSVCQAEARPLAGQASSLEKECSRLERDLEEGSRRLAMAHSEIRRLTDELESAHLTRRAYEPELQSAQLEVEQLRQEVEKLKKYEMVELRKAKELNDRLDLEIRALRNRVRTLDTEKSSLQQTVASLQVEVERMESALLAQQQVLPLQVEMDQAEEITKAQTEELAQSNKICINLQDKLNALTLSSMEKEEVVESLQKEVKRLESVLQEQQQLRAVQVPANCAKSREAEVMESNQTCRYVHNKISGNKSCILEKQSEIFCPQFVDNYHSNLNNIIAKICTKENNLKDQRLSKEKNIDSQTGEKNDHSQLENSFITENKDLQTSQLSKESTPPKECSDCQQAMKTLLSTQEECKTLRKEICDTLKCLDKERSKYHNMKEKQKEKLSRVKKKIDDETTWRDVRMKNLERELTLSAHSLTKEKELVVCITVENEKLLSERRKLLQQLNEEEHHKTHSNLTASLSKCRVDFLDTENRKLGNKLLHMSNQIAFLERSLQNMQPLHFVEELQKKSNHQQISKSLTVHTSRVMSEIQDLLDSTQSRPTKQIDVTSSSPRSSSGALYGYLNLTSMQSLPDCSAPHSSLRDSDSWPS